MGAKFLHTHAHTSEAGTVADALCQLARAHGFTITAKDEPCDHAVVVAKDAASPAWTSIYGRFADVSWELSEKLSTHVVVLSIFDSDVLEARLYNDGCEVDAFCNYPDHVGESARSLKGQPKRWESLCVQGTSWRDVRQAFKNAEKSPEKALVELGRVVGLDERSLYPDHVDRAGPAVHRLRFRNPPARRRKILEGAPQVRASSGGRMDMKMSAGAEACSFMASSAGGGSTGMEIAIGGAAIASGLIAIESVRFRGATGVLRERKGLDGSWLVAEIGNAGLPAASGVVDESQMEAPVADYCPPVQLEVTVKPMRIGEAELQIRWTPIEPATPPCVQRLEVRVND